MQIEVGACNTITDGTPQFKAWLRDHGVIPNPEYVKKARMGFWVKDIPPKIYLFEVNGDKVIVPYGSLRQILEACPEAKVVNTFKPPRHVDFECTIPLYEYQEEALNAMRDSFYGILQSPAGSGKTQIGIALAAAIGVKTLWLTHTLDLVKQSKDRAKRYMPERLIGEISNGKIEIGKAITFATVQTMANIDLDKYADEWDCVIVDECHRAAGTPAAATRFFKVLNKLRARHKYGLSATVHRSDGMIAATYALLGEVVHTVPDSAVADKVMKVGICPIPTEVRVGKGCLNTDGTINYAGMIKYLVENEDRNKVLLDWLKQNKDHSCLILSDRVGHLNALMEALPAYMKNKATMVHGKMTDKLGKEQRELSIEWMRTGKKKYLFATYALAKEGLDIPCLDRLFLTTPQKDFAVITQSIGRIARTAPGKGEPIAYDFVDNGIQALMRMYQIRCRHYRKNGCHFIEVSDE